MRRTGAGEREAEVELAVRGTIERKALVSVPDRGSDNHNQDGGGHPAVDRQGEGAPQRLGKTVGKMHRPPTRPHVEDRHIDGADPNREEPDAPESSKLAHPGKFCRCLPPKSPWKRPRPAAQNAFHGDLQNQEKEEPPSEAPVRIRASVSTASRR